MKSFCKKLLNKSWLLFLLIIGVQLAVLIYWGNRKANFYWDECNSYSYAHYASDSTPEFTYFQNTKLYSDSSDWIEMTDLKELYTINSDNTILLDSPKSVAKEIKKQGYMVLLNAIEGLFFPGKITKWSGISVNLVLFVVCQLFVYLTAKEITDNKYVALLAVTILGFCGETLSTVNFVRFYVYSYTLLVIATYLHIITWKYSKWYKNLILEAVSMLLIFLSYGESELAIAYGGLLVGFYSLALMIKKRWIEFCYYSVPIMLCGVIYVYKKTVFIKALLHPDRYISMLEGDTIAYRVSSFKNLSAANFFQRTKDYLIAFMGKYLFGSIIVLIMVLVCIIFLWAVNLIGRKTVKTDKIDKGQQFLHILLGIVVGYSLFLVIFEMKHIRYHSIMYPELAICFVCGIYFLCKKINGLKAYYVGALVTALSLIIITNLTPQIEYNYYFDKEASEIISEVTEEYGCAVRSGSWNSVQECIFLSDDNSKLFRLNDDECVREGFPDTYLLWIPQELSEEEVSLLSEYGYNSIEIMCTTYQSTIYKVSR